MEREGQAAIDAAVDFTIDQFKPRELRDLAAAIDEEVDAGSFAVGLQVAAFLMLGVNPIEAAIAYPEPIARLVRECRAKYEEGSG